MTTDPNADFADLREALAKATPGPWKWWTANSWRRLKRDDRGITQSVAEPFVARDGHPNLDISERDMEFIALARNQLPALLAAYDEALSRAEKAEAAISELADEHMQLAREFDTIVNARAEPNDRSLVIAALTAANQRIAELEGALAGTETLNRQAHTRLRELHVEAEAAAASMRERCAAIARHHALEG